MAKILIVDDDPGTTNLLEVILRRDGYDVVSVNNSNETLSSALAYSPDLILLDLLMPNVDGFEVCRNLRAEPRIAYTPIVFFTSIGDVEQKVAAFAAGANDFITKPIHPQELKLRIRALIGHSG